MEDFLMKEKRVRGGFGDRMVCCSWSEDIDGDDGDRGVGVRIRPFFNPGTLITPSRMPYNLTKSSSLALGWATSKRSRNASWRSMWNSESSAKTSWMILRVIYRSRITVSRWRDVIEPATVPLTLSEEVEPWKVKPCSAGMVTSADGEDIGTPEGKGSLE